MKIKNSFRETVPFRGKGSGGRKGELEAKGSCFGSILYDPETGDLTLSFLNTVKGVWIYHNVQPYEAAGLIASSSQGKYFNQYIKNGNYEYERIG